ncbi:MAG: hypothetical protein JWL72_3575 [Ilumatobacteraceae bacterium]|nr:hypothetical protein [Ilumatobacteraceae bacterium]MCU1390237.1 hypothetical protein [Ilumatobacteraceae bacterium]
MQHGRCDCGGVSFDLEGELRDVYNCHCDRCRRVTGHHMAATAVHPDNLRFATDTTLRWYEPSPGVHYGFCGHCGSTLFWKADAESTKICIAAGSLDQPTGLRTTKAWWVAEAGDYHDRQAGVAEFEYED